MWMLIIGILVALVYVFLNRMYAVKSKPSFFRGIYI